MEVQCVNQPLLVLEKKCKSKDCIFVQDSYILDIYVLGLYACSGLVGNPPPIAVWPTMLYTLHVPDLLYKS